MPSVAQSARKWNRASAGGVAPSPPALGAEGIAAAGTPAGSPRPPWQGTPVFIQDNTPKVTPPHPRELSRAAKDKRHQLQLEQDLEALGLDDEARKVWNCNRLYPEKHEDCGAVFWRSTGFRCHNPLCVYCLRDREDKLAARWAPVLADMIAEGHQLAKVMLSTRRYPGETLDDAYVRASAGLRKLLRSKKWRRYVPGELVATEVAFSTGWGVHYHLIVELAGYFPQAELSRLWHECTTDSMVVWIEAIGTAGVTLEQALAEQIKYPCKPASILGSPERVDEYGLWARGKQLFKASGTFHGAVKAHQEKVAGAEGLSVEEYEAREEEKVRQEHEDLRDTCPYCGGHGNITPVYGEGAGRAAWECYPLNKAYWGLAPPGDPVGAGLE